MTSRFRVVPAAYVLLLRDGAGGAGGSDEVLLHLRANTGFRDGYWAAAAAGHVERGESVHEAAHREAREEIGIDPLDLTPLLTLHRTENTGDDVDERVDFFFTCRRWTGEPQRREPDKSDDLRWFGLDALPEPLVLHERRVLETLRAGSVPAIATHGFTDAGDSLLR